jgi:DNA-binding beta-propeller fold protein YncE
MAGISLTPAGTYETGVFDEGAAEIVAHDPKTQRVFVINADASVIDVLDISDPSNPNKLFDIDVSVDVPEAGGINSVDVKKGLVAVAVQNDDGTKNGFAAFYDTDGNPRKFFNGHSRNFLEVGNLPDAIKFSPDGRQIIVSNEGEPADAVDPKGSVSIIDIKGKKPQAPAVTLYFTKFDADQAALESAGVKIEPGKLLSDDVEPEYAAFSPDGKEAFVTLQEANAFAVVDCFRKKIKKIIPLGFKDHSSSENPIDASNEDDAINIQNWPLHGMYQPDGIDSFKVRGRTFYITANEGDARDAEVERIEDVVLDPAIFPDAATLQMEENLGRLQITAWLGDTDNDRDFDELFSFGGRSFSIWDDRGQLIYDSADDFEQITAAVLPAQFNSNNTDNDSFDSRSDDKGPEPEGVVVGKVKNKTYAFIGLERISGIMIYDITKPTSPKFVDYVNDRNFDVDAQNPDGSSNSLAGDLGPEGLFFIPPSESPNGKALLVVGNEVSGTTTVYEVDD